MPDETPTQPTTPETPTQPTTPSTPPTPPSPETPKSPETPSETSLLNAKDPAKPEGDKPPSDKSAGPPDKYESFKLPEGVAFKEESLAAAQTLFKDLGLPQEGAQKLVDFHVKALTEASQAPLQAAMDMRAEWKTQAEKLPDIGGQLGPGGKVNVAYNRMLASLGDEKLASDFRAAMDLTGVGNHPAFIQAIWKWSSAFAEAGHVPGNGPSKFGQQQPGAKPQSLAHALYPKLP